MSASTSLIQCRQGFLVAGLSSEFNLGVIFLLRVLRVMRWLRLLRSDFRAVVAAGRIARPGRRDV